MSGNNIIEKPCICLPVDFYERPTDIVARELLGKVIIRKTSASTMMVRIVEVEAYFGDGDPASHACRGVTPRNAIMFGRAGKTYVYLNYGVHYLLNVVSEREGCAGAVLIRAVEPLSGIEEMLINRPVKSIIELTNGPGKLTKALNIDLRDNGADVTDSEGNIYITDTNPEKFTIIASPRIGISNGKDMLLRFSIEGNEFVSGSKKWRQKDEVE